MDALAGLGQPQAIISRTALLQNVKLLRRDLGPAVRICAIVKADAYGHGAAMVADALTIPRSDDARTPAVDALAVVTIDEGLALGEPCVPVFVLRPLEGAYIGPQRQQVELALRRGFVLTVATPAGAGDLARIAIACSRRADVQVMVDTGHAREGTPIDRLPALLETIDSYPSLKLTALCTHFASSEEPLNPFTTEQLRHFLLATAAPVLKNPRLIRHAANSGGIFFSPATHLDMVRPGISLYGIDPTCQPSPKRPLRPVLKWVAPLSMIRRLQKGASVGYNQTWHADRDTPIGLVPVGYADGYLRAFSSRAKMIIRGKAVPVVGRVSMDYVTIDLRAVPDAHVGDEVTVLDNDPLSPASVYELARCADTIPYEIFCRIGPRVRRVMIEPPDNEESNQWHTQDSTSPAKSA